MNSDHPMMKFAHPNAAAAAKPCVVRVRGANWQAMTNGHACLLTRTDEEANPEPWTGNSKDWFAPSNGARKVDIATLLALGGDVPVDQECGWCKGSAVRRCDMGHEHTCDQCTDGRVEEDTVGVGIFGVNVNALLLRATLHGRQGDVDVIVRGIGSRSRSSAKAGWPASWGCDLGMGRSLQPSPTSPRRHSDHGRNRRRRRIPRDPRPRAIRGSHGRILRARRVGRARARRRRGAPRNGRTWGVRVPIAGR